MKKMNNNGYSILELFVSYSIGIIVVGTAGYILFSSKKMTNQLSKKSDFIVEVTQLESLFMDEDICLSALKGIELSTDSPVELGEKISYQVNGIVRELKSFSSQHKYKVQLFQSEDQDFMGQLLIQLIDNNERIITEAPVSLFIVTGFDDKLIRCASQPLSPITSSHCG